MKIIYKLANKDDLERVISCINSTFCQDEPISKSLNLTLYEFESFVRIFAKRSVENKHIILALNDKDRLLGCLISEDFKLPLPDEANNLDQKMAPVFSILGDLDYNFLLNNPGIKNKKILHLLMLGVFPEYSGNKISENLIKFQEMHAADDGYELAIAEVTGPKSQRVFQKMGYEIGHRINYHRYVFQGMNIYSNIEDCETCDLVYKKLK